MFLPVQIACYLFMQYPLGMYFLRLLTSWSSANYSSNLSMILASSLFVQLTSTFFPVLALLIGYIPAQPGFSNALFPPRLPRLESFLSEHQFCPSVQALGFQCVHSSYKAFLSCGVSSSVLSPPPAWLDSSDSNKRGSNFPVVILRAWIQHGLQAPWTLVGSVFEWSKLGKCICKMSRDVTKLFQIEMFRVLLICSDLKTSL